jgi:Siphovirus-type tail component, C-terminal domain
MNITVNYRSIEFASPNYLDLALDGVLSLPELESHDLAYSTANGLMPGTDFARGKTMNFSGTVVAEDDATFGTAIENLRLAFEQREFETELFVSTIGLAGGRQVGIRCRPRRSSLKIDLDYDARQAAFSVDLFATDPYFRAASGNSPELHVYIVFINATTGGHGFDHGFDLSFGGGGSTATIAVNDGNAKAWPLMTFYGPCVNPRIQNQAYVGNGLSFDITLGPTDYLFVDASTKSITLNGPTNRYDVIADSDWFPIEPGNNPIVFTVASTTGVPTVTVSYADTWL